MIPENEIDMGSLREAVTGLNETGLLDAKIKVVGLAKKDMIDQLAKAVEDLAKQGKDNLLPEVVKTFYNTIFQDELLDEAEDKAPPEEKEEKVAEKKKAVKKEKAAKNVKPAKEKKEKKEKKVKEPKPKSRYGHVLNSQAGILDDMFHAGCKIEEAAEKAGVKVGRVRGHLNHLRKDKSVTINEVDGFFKAVE